MAFFNYSTMQMTAKVVYYGPGLGGKTTNLEFIYAHTTENTRGEMVSLETQTDRTLFFDLLPLEVGAVAGFKTKIQLYTVPGQVFYNSTRKLVLKGVDGVVFVADSQAPMMQSNLEAIENLDENLDELGLSLEHIPLVIQYNKRDLPEILPFGELQEALNPNGAPAFEASALTGEGVFETLREISKLTLASLKDQLDAGGTATTTTGPPARDTTAAAPPAAPAAAPAPLPERPALTKQIRRDFVLRLPAREFEEAERVSAQLKIVDHEGRPIRASQALDFPIEQHDDLTEVQVQLNLNIKSED